MGLFILWTTFVCLNGEMRSNVFRNMYSNQIYTSKAEIDKASVRWQRIYGKGDCIAFMMQKEEISQKAILKDILRLYVDISYMNKLK